MHSINRRTFLRLLAAGAISQLNKPSRLYASESGGDSVRFSPDIACNLADSFARANYLELSLSTSSPISVLDSSGSFVGFEVDYYSDTLPYGYILFDVRYSGLLSRFRVQKNTIGLYGETTNMLHESVPYAASDHPVLVTFDPFTYGILDNSSNSLLLPDSNESSPQLSDEGAFANAKDPSTWWDTFISYEDAYNGTWTIKNPVYSFDLITVTESQVEKAIKRYACAVHALYCLAASIPNADNSDFLISNPYNSWSEYKSIWNYTGTTDNHTSNGITYGMTKDTKVGSGFKSYCLSKGKQINYSYFANPSFNKLKTHLSQPRPLVIHAGINTSSGESGHSMVSNGAATLSRSGQTINCLSVFNGWSDMVYINYDFGKYTRFAATLFDFAVQ